MKQNENDLINNRDTALDRFFSLEKKFEKNPKFPKLYHNEISKYINESQVRILTEEEAPFVSNKQITYHIMVF